MGHGDTICFADANFPSETCLKAPGSPGPITIRADGHEVTPLLRAVSKLFPLDSYTDCPVKMMAPVIGDELDPSIEKRFEKAVEAEQVIYGCRYCIKTVEVLRPRCFLCCLFGDPRSEDMESISCDISKEVCWSTCRFCAIHPWKLRAGKVMSVGSMRPKRCFGCSSEKKKVLVDVVLRTLKG